MDQEVEKKVLKVFSADRRLRKAILSSSYEDFISSCKVKFNVTDSRQISFVIEEDGTEVDNDYFSVLSNNMVLMMLLDEEEWTPSTGGTLGSATPSGNSIAAASRVMKMIDKLQKNKKTEKPVSSQKKSKMMTVLAGWQHWGLADHRYKLVKSTRKHPNAGPRPITLSRNATYEGVLDSLKNVFFQKGRSSKGRLSRMTCQIGNAKGEPFPATSEFTLEIFVAECGTQKARIYLLTKEKFPDFEELDTSSSSSSSSDFEMLSTESSPSTTQHTTDVQTEQSHDLLPQTIADPNLATTTPDSELEQDNITTPTQSHNLQLSTFSTPNQNSIMEPSALATPIQKSSIHQQLTFATPSSQSDMQSATFATCLQSSQTPNLTSVTTSHSSDGLQQQKTWINAGTPTVSFQVNRRTCNICFEREKNAFFVPCGHTACMVCSVQIQCLGQTCPSCRADIRQVKSMFD